MWSIFWIFIFKKEAVACKMAVAGSKSVRFQGRIGEAGLAKLCKSDPRVQFSSTLKGKGIAFTEKKLIKYIFWQIFDFYVFKKTVTSSLGILTLLRKPQRGCEVTDWKRTICQNINWKRRKHFVYFLNFSYKVSEILSV